MRKERKQAEVGKVDMWREVERTEDGEKTDSG